jgi:microcystin-dependent protein
MTSVLSRNATFTAHTKPTTGDIKSSFVSVDHLGWLNCNGRYLSTVTYNLLFQVIGYTYGSSEGGANFRLPNMGGRVIGSEGTIVEPSGTYVFPSGTVTGEVEHLLLLAEMPRHNHDDSTAPVVAGVPPADGNTSTATTGIVINPNATGVTVNYGTSNVTVNSATTGITLPDHSHGSNATGGSGGPGLVIKNNAGTPGSIDAASDEINCVQNPIALSITAASIVPTDTGHVHGITEPTITAVPLVQGHNHGITDPQHAHTITDLGHHHTISSNGNSEYHNNMQPTIFYGNTFVYCGIPTTTNLVQANPNWQNSWPYAVPQSNPPLL